MPSNYVLLQHITYYKLWSIHTYLFYLAPTVSFEQQTYSVDENSESVQAVLNLSKPSPNDITALVLNRDRSATGKYYIRRSVVYCLLLMTKTLH